MGCVNAYEENSKSFFFFFKKDPKINIDVERWLLCPLFYILWKRHFYFLVLGVGTVQHQNTNISCLSNDVAYEYWIS